MAQNSISEHLSQLQATLDSHWQKLELKKAEAEIKELDKIMAEANFWQNSQSAKIGKRRAEIAKQLAPWQEIRSELQNLMLLAKEETSSDLKDLIAQWEDKLGFWLKQNDPSRKYDACEVILSIFAGAGGTDAQDWAAMLLRMYQRWAEKQRAKTEIISFSAGEVAGLKSVSLQIKNQSGLYGLLKGEHGVHRLVRRSPFNAQNLRQTSFAKVEILPDLEDDSEFEIKDSELKFDVFKSGGPGGQSVNTTDSAVRLTHLPTNISIKIQNERSQLQNKQLALKILKARLKQRQEEAKKAELNQLKEDGQANEWGHQIRNYVLHPYKQVKDLRTLKTITDIESVLNGDLLDEFIAAYADLSEFKQ